jgi:hypothetical protein
VAVRAAPLVSPRLDLQGEQVPKAFRRTSTGEARQEH